MRVLTTVAETGYFTVAYGVSERATGVCRQVARPQSAQRP